MGDSPGWKGAVSAISADRRSAGIAEFV